MKAKTINPESLPKHFEAERIEKELDARWQSSGMFAYDATRSREETFVVDTPPPTVSGSLHMGHVFSYTHTDIIVRYQRMRGKNIFYPMGWDDNGLPTERRVQNYFHVRCDVHAPYEKDLKLEPATDAQRKERPRIVSRQNFIELCAQVTHEDEVAFMGLFKRIGLSVDWAQTYATIDARCRKLAQQSFLDLFNKGHVYSVEAPTMWDIDFQTAVAQAEVEDREQPGAYHHVAFQMADGSGEFVIATTRPELLAACVGVAAHPSDKRYQALFGKKAVTPLFGVEVPIFATELADPEKGTGILMVCTFGDQTDVKWWREEKLQLRQIIGRDGRLMPIEFGKTGWESRDAGAANAMYGELIGKTVSTARKLVVEALGKPDGQGRAPLREAPKPIQHAVKFFEKGDRPLELITTRQWFVRLLDKKEDLIGKGDAIKWHPDFMRLRYRNWTENLNLDWCVSRQRFFGVPFPVWYKLDEKGMVNYDQPIVAPAEMMPVDPMVHVPTGFSEDQRGKPGGFIGESDVFDTWFTSSLSPQIGSHWLADNKRHASLFPADIRPQSHEIIRTWAFYTIAKAMLHENTIPWRHVVISGWILDPDRKKMSKSKGNVVTPMHLLDNYTSDGVRYWAAGARLGMDTAFDENVLKLGKRLVTKVYNAAKFVLSQEGELGEICEELDRAFLHKLATLVDEVTGKLDEFDFAHALMVTEKFFWGSFTDTYLELVKLRARDVANVKAQASAVSALRLGLNVLLRLLAPVLPYVCEEVWGWVFAGDTGHASIHTAPWPSAVDFKAVAKPMALSALDVAAECYGAINKFKSEAGASVAREIADLNVQCQTDDEAVLKGVWSDLVTASHAQGATLQVNALPEGTRFVVSGRVLPKAE